MLAWSLAACIAFVQSALKSGFEFAGELANKLADRTAANKCLLMSTLTAITGTTVSTCAFACLQREQLSPVPHAHAKQKRL